MNVPLVLPTATLTLTVPTLKARIPAPVNPDSQETGHSALVLNLLMLVTYCRRNTLLRKRLYGFETISSPRNCIEKDACFFKEYHGNIAIIICLLYKVGPPKSCFT